MKAAMGLAEERWAERTGGAACPPEFICSCRLVKNCAQGKALGGSVT